MQFPWFLGKMNVCIVFYIQFWVWPGDSKHRHEVQDFWYSLVLNVLKLCIQDGVAEKRYITDTKTTTLDVRHISRSHCIETETHTETDNE